MRHIILFICLFISVAVSAQTNSVREQSNSQTFPSFGFGVNVGYTTANFFTVDINAVFKKMYLGLSISGNTKKPIKGKCYNDVISWEKNHLDDPLEDSGSFKDFRFGIDLGYTFLNDKLCVGAGLGWLSYLDYKQYFDNTYILDTDGWYHLTQKGVTKIDPKLFVNYNFKKENNPIYFLIHAQYTYLTQFGLGIGVGVDF